MSDEFSFMTIFFRLFNFALLMAVFYYIFKKYIKHQAEEKINQKESLLKGLKEQGYMLEGKGHNLELRMKFQEDKMQKLKERIQEWNQAVKIEQEKRKEENARLFQAIAQRMHHKNEEIKKTYLKSIIIPQVVNAVRTDLHKEFADQEKGKNYLQELFTHLKGY